MSDTRSARVAWQQPVDCLTHRSVRVPVVAPPVKHAASAPPARSPGTAVAPLARLGARAHLSHAARMTWTFILVLSPCRSVYSFGGAHARIGNITPWASWRRGGHPADLPSERRSARARGRRPVCVRTNVYAAIRSSGATTAVERAAHGRARSSLRGAPSGRGQSLRHRGGPGPNVCGPRAGRRRGAGVSRPSAPAKRGPRARPLVR